MCKKRLHTFRMTISVDNVNKCDLVCQAKGMAGALAKGDAWAAHNYPNGWVQISIHRAPYGNRAVAEEHGADFADVDERERVIAEHRKAGNG